ncbi:MULTISPECIES: tripartite tricarboxylate transporter TctB family protein [unclassified Vibrio]|uniref:Tripartite tricarboxylate transporter TctB family protein n=1 Tax=Vibrio sp. HB236076 TaxID=3232307 RepID=A0AB39HDC3_9VIBR|nr:tripartite tricarboxylate transporter TctB family protein [Vibrio sp. HB161653]MDP5254691.1 tripartite tricarboxylate transporter TctB family protein [Vibrio sp. HB161653]
MSVQSNQASSSERANWDGVTGLFSIAFGCAYGGYALALPQPMFGNPLEAIFMPLAIAAIAIFIGGLLIVKGGLRPSWLAIRSLLNESEQHKNNRRKIAITCVISLIYAATFEHLGYVLSTFVFMFAMLMVTCGAAKWKKNAFIALVFALGVYLIFNQLLAVNLPSFPFIN